MNKFKDLKVYAKALLFSTTVRQTAKRFPSNIAEDVGSSSKKEFARFLDYSIRSGFECIGCIDIALQNEFVGREQYDKVLSEVNEIIAMLYGLQKSQLR